MAFSYVIGWPVIAVLGFLSVKLDNAWLIAVGIAVGLLLTVKLVRDFLVRHLFRRDQERDDDINALVAAIVKSVSMPIVAVLFAYIGIQGLDMPKKWSVWVPAVATIAVILQITRSLNVLITFWYKRYQKKYVHDSTIYAK